LCLSAGIKCVSMSNFRAAFQYFTKGVSLLGSNAWQSQYSLCLELHNSVAEVSNTIGAHEQNFEHVEEVLAHARTFDDTLRARAAKVHAIGGSGEFHEALHEGLSILEQLGVSISTQVSKVRFVLDWMSLSRRLRKNSIESLMRLPEMADQEKLGAMQVLNLIQLYALLICPPIVPIIGMHMMQLTLDYGLSAVSSIGFGIYAFSLCVVGDGDIDRAYQFAQLSKETYKRYGIKAFLPRLSVIYFEGVHSWKRPVREMFAPLQSAYRIGMETGDVEFAALCAVIPTWTKYEMGELSQLHKELVSLRERMSHFRQSTFDLIIRPVHQSIQSLMGLTENPTILRGEAFDEDLNQKVRRENIHQVVDFSVVHEVILSSLFGQYQRAQELSCKCKRVATPHSGPMAGSIVFFFCGFANVACAREQQNSLQRWKQIRTARRYSRILQKWSIHCPPNFLGKHLFLEAELAALSKSNLAFSKYVAAIGALKEGGFLAQIALANERLAYYLHNEKRDAEAAKPYFQEALSYYRKWGAVAKVDHFLNTAQSLGIVF